MTFLALRVLRLDGSGIQRLSTAWPIPAEAHVLRELHLSQLTLDKDRQDTLFSSLKIPWN
jgi:hypothetical protein